jgi:hypothetical protein
MFKESPFISAWAWAWVGGGAPTPRLVLTVVWCGVGCRRYRTGSPKGKGEAAASLAADMEDDT